MDGQHPVHVTQPTSEIYKQAYQNLIDIDLINMSTTHISPSPIIHSAPPPPQNNSNAQAVNSPFRRPRSSSDNDRSELDDFQLDPEIRTIVKKKKRPKTGNNRKSPNLVSSTSATTNIPAPRDQNTHTVITTQQPGDNPLNSRSITAEAKAFAQTRYPFPPFILRFSTPYIDDQNIVKDLCRFLKVTKQLDLELIAYRKSTIKCSSSECDLLLYVKNSLSFSILYEDANWPNILLGLTFTIPSKPSIPPQLSLIVKNVSLLINLEHFANDIKSTYACAQNVIRMKNKHQMDIKWIKVEFTHPKQRDEILMRRKLLVNSLAYDVDEYLAPARVLICSKCMGIGHFRKQCQQELSTCKKCGTIVDNINDHILICSTTKCKHCQGDHLSNDMRCPLVKQFRADLTKSLLSSLSQSSYIHSNSTSAHVPLSGNGINPTNSHQRAAWTNNNIVNYQAAVTTNNTAIDSITTKLDDLTNNMKQMNTLLEKIIAKNDQFEQFIRDKTTYDELVASKIIDLTEGLKKNASLTTQHELKIARHENILTKVVFPMLDEIAKFVSNLNNSNQGRPLDADFKQSINRMRAQLNNAKLNKVY